LGATTVGAQRLAAATSVRAGAPLLKVMRVVTFCTAGPWRRNVTRAVILRTPGVTVTVRARRPLTEKRTWRIDEPFTVTRAWRAAHASWTDSRIVGAELTRSPATATIETVVLREALHGDVDRALELGGVVADDAREHPAPRSLADEIGIVVGQERDHRARGVADEGGDELERAFRAGTEADEDDLGMLMRDRVADGGGVQLAHDGVVSQPGDDVGEQVDVGMPLVRDQHPAALDLTGRHDGSADPTPQRNGKWRRSPL
jgi:hypothetical protein